MNAQDLLERLQNLQPKSALDAPVRIIGDKTHLMGVGATVWKVVYEGGMVYLHVK